MKIQALYDIMDCATRKALEILQVSDSHTAIVDLYLQPNPEAGEFTVLDDEDHTLVKMPVDVWQEQYETIDVEAELKIAEEVLRKLIQVLNKEGLFETISTIKPFSVLMINEDMETLAELLLLDDEQYVLDDDFLNHLDKDLTNFYEKLMSDI